MMNRSPARSLRKALLPLLLVCISVAAQAADPAPAFVETMADPALLANLQKGGFVLYMRHGTTDNSRADRAPDVDLNDCSTQRVLNDEGRKLAVAVGQAIRKAKIPVNEIFHSPLCRARESAELAFPEMRSQLKQEINLMYTANLTSEQKKPVLLVTRKILSTPVAPGSNRVVLAHAPNMADLIGYFVKPEGTVVVIRPTGPNTFEYVASIPPTLWTQLLK